MHNPQDVAICSQVRLMRNYDDLLFPAAMTEEDAGKSRLMTYDALCDAGLDGEFDFLKMSELPQARRLVLSEKGWISPALARGGAFGAALLRKNQKSAILMNEEDHLCIQSTLPGFSLMGCADEVMSIEKKISPYLKVAFDKQFGFLTANPVCAGTGLRASVLLHLPAYARQNKILPLMKEVGAQGLLLRSLCRDDAQGSSELFWLSTRIALGRTEQEMLDTLEMAAWEVVEKEREEREKLLLNKQAAVEDRGMRAFGIFQYARKMDEKEFVRRWSDMRFAVLAGILRFPLSRLDALLQRAQNGHLSMENRREMTAEEADIARAKLLREEMER